MLKDTLLQVKVTADQAAKIARLRLLTGGDTSKVLRSLIDYVVLPDPKFDITTVEKRTTRGKRNVA